MKCRHTDRFTDGRCSTCGYVCTHETIGSGGKCTVCGKQIFDPTAISVDITWEEMSFTFAPGRETWDHENHIQGREPDTWVWDGETDGRTAPVITVTNKSFQAVTAKLAFTGSEGITGQFSRTSLELAAATVTDTPAETVRFRITGGTIDKKQSLGSITVTIGTVSPEGDNKKDTEGEA